MRIYFVRLYSIRLLFIGMCFLHLGNSVANAAEDDSQEVARILRMLSVDSSGWREVSQSLQFVSTHIDNESVSSKLAGVLQAETNYQKENFGTVTEERGEYYLELISVIGIVNNGDIAILPLINSLGLVGGMGVANSLSKFGNEAIVPLWEKYNSLLSSSAGLGVLIRTDILFTVKHIINTRLDSTNIWVLTDQQYYSLASLLLKGMNEENSFAKKWATDAYESIGDDTFLDDHSLIEQ